MREIKFRAWIKEEKVLTSWEEIQEGYGFDYVFEHQEKVELMQYTGLKDKNGKEIYEGDIVLCFSTKRCPHTVIWNGVGWDLEGLYDGYRWGGEEVIGNIYESPELLEEK